MRAGTGRRSGQSRRASAEARPRAAATSVPDRTETASRSSSASLVASGTSQGRSIPTVSATGISQATPCPRRKPCETNRPSSGIAGQSSTRSGCRTSDIPESSAEIGPLSRESIFFIQTVSGPAASNSARVAAVAFVRASSGGNSRVPRLTDRTSGERASAKPRASSDTAETQSIPSAANGAIESSDPVRSSAIRTVIKADMLHIVLLGECGQHVNLPSPCQMALSDCP